MGDPPSDQSEWLWQSPWSRSKRAAASALMAVGSADSSASRYAGVSPASASRMTWALVLPTPGMLWSPAEVTASSSVGTSAMAAAA